MNIQYCIDMAAKQAYVRKQSRHYAVVLDKKGRVVGEAANSYQKTHPIMKKTSNKLGLHKEYCHAEALAIVRAKGKGEKLIVARVDNNNKSCYSAPCPICAFLAKEAGIKSIEFTI